MDASVKMIVVLRNNNSTLSMNQVEVYDNVCDAPVGVFTLKGGESRSITIGQGNDGKGSVKIRNLELEPNEWLEIASISPGDVLAV